MPGWLNLKARQRLKEQRQEEMRLAWGALWEIATRTPFVRKVDVVDQDSSYYVAEALVDSGELIKSLDALLHGVVDPNAEFVVPLVAGAREVRVLADMLPAWMDHVDTRSPMPAAPAADTSWQWAAEDDAAMEKARRALHYISGTAMGEWSRAAEAEAAVERAQRALDQLYPALVDLYGYDVTTGRWAA